MYRVLYDLKVTLRNYWAFHLLVLLVANGILMSAILTRDKAQLSRAYGNEAVWTACTYCVTYWLTHWRFACALVVALLLLFAGEIFRPTFHSMFRTPLLPTVQRPRYLPYLRNGVRTLKVLFAAWLVLHIPLIHLATGTWASILLYLLTPLPVVVLYVCLYGGVMRLPRPRRALARHVFPAKSFDVAGVAVVSHDAQREVDYYEQVAPRWGYIIRGDTRGQTRWRGHNAFIEKISGLLGVDRAQIRLFTNTTDAIRHALRECIGAMPRQTERRQVLTTDAEWDTVRRVIDTVCQRHNGEVSVAGIRDAIFEGQSPAKIGAEIIKRVNPKVSIVCISYMFYESGFVAPIGMLLEHIEAMPPKQRPFVIVDAAQAVGHILLDPEVFRRAHYLATSGHKWLLGQETTGILWSNTKEGATPPTPDELPISISLSRFAPVKELENERGPTIALGPRLTLNASLTEITAQSMRQIAEHNARLCSRFKEQLDACPGFRVVPVQANNGICVVAAEGRHPGELAVRLRRRGIIVGFNPGRKEGEAGTLRVCFHYYHSEVDVDNLVEALVLG